MLRARCCKDIFGYCTDPPGGAMRPLQRGDGKEGYTAMGNCPNDWRDCPKYIYHSVVGLPTPAKAKKQRTRKAKEPTLKRIE